jgi:IS30 family transposase
MHKGINLLEETLGPELFRKEIEVLLTDRGGEFIAADLFATGLDGTKRTKLFYCDPMCSHQKGSLENNHLELRYICPKKCNLYALGLTSQRKMNQVTSNINSVVKRELGHKSPFQLLEFYSPEFYQKLRDFGIVEVPCDEVLLKPHLLK